jgi:hypothetical protein
MKYTNLFWIVVIALGVTLYLLGGINGDEEKVAEATPTPTPTPTATQIVDMGDKTTPTPTSTPEGDDQVFEGFPDQSLVGEVPSRDLITGPATCQLSNGTITFSDSQTAINSDAYLSYQNVDHPGRLIFWTISPDNEAFDIGPNIFSKLPLPDGIENLTVIVNKEDLIEKTYILTAKVNYGIEGEGGGVVRTEEVDCTGKITVVLDYLE